MITSNYSPEFNELLRSVSMQATNITIPKDYKALVVTLYKSKHGFGVTIYHINQEGQVLTVKHHPDIAKAPKIFTRLISRMITDWAIYFGE